MYQTNLQIKHEILKKGGKVKFKRFRKNGNDHFHINIYIDGEKDEFDQLERVEYELHPTFNNPNRSITKREDGFPLKIWTWGEFDIQVTFYFLDGKVSDKVYQLRYSNELPTKEDDYIDLTSKDIVEA